MKYRILQSTIFGATVFLVLVALAFSITTPVPAQEPSTEPTPAAVTKAELHQALLDLTNPWTVMCVAAHPDDEDGTTLTVLRRKHGAHTVSLFSTYGEGGQNAVGPELYEELGVIRYHETLKASEIQGSEPHFLGLKDFGFSKSMEETFRFWNREEALKRMVLKLRELRPDVIITNHDTARGHGHHQATGQLLLEAFDAAADPKRFPEQLTNNVKPWQVQRLFVRIFGGPTPNAQAPAAAPAKIISIDPNEIDPIRETSFAEQALAALQQHRSQGPWPKSVADMMRARRIESGKLPPIRYRLVREAANAPPLPDTAATPFDGLKLAPQVAERLSPPTIDGRPLNELVDQQARVLYALINWRVANADAPAVSEDAPRVALFDARVDKALAVAAGVSLNISSDRPLLIRGEKNTFGVNLINGGIKPLQITRLAFKGWGKESELNVPDHLLADTEASAAVELTTPENAPFTVPKVERLYDEFLSGIPFDASAEVDIESAKFVVKHRKHFDVVPAVEITNVAPSPCVSTDEAVGHCGVFKLSLTNHTHAPFRGLINIFDDAGHAVMNRRVVMGAQESRVEKIVNFDFRPSRGATRKLGESAFIRIEIASDDGSREISSRTVALVHARARVAPDLNVAYIPSFDQTLERALESFGLEGKELTLEDIKTKGLAGYDTIIIDNRGYEAHPGLIEANSRLMQFVEEGGTLIVFYHKDNEWNPDPAKNRPQLAPYPIVLGGDRVTDENAPIRFLQPRHRLMNYPNRILQADFKNWIQERGLYYPKEWDKQYTALFSTNDRGEPALRGGLLVAKKGLGNYIYTSMVWYRQLRAGVPGSYRMFANMISYGKRPGVRSRRVHLTPSIHSDVGQQMRMEGEPSDRKAEPGAKRSGATATLNK